jgi:hypothetical protein
VLVVGSVLLALIPAKAASFGTGLERRPRHLWLEGRLTGKDPAPSVAHVGAVEVKADTAGQRLGVVLAEASVGASCTALSAVVAGFYTLDQRGGIHCGAARVSLEHLLGVGHEELLPVGGLLCSHYSHLCALYIRVLC